ncbi:hypothetical protein BN873_100043 [Candidatus Competibacter denitrificans Run_A_D11]|uniref:Uncharacterized protein n=1 Tax=Candidatus Competibacter denitrificans Run_A_D11 TaxID=1400863 RepID=W6M0Z7_9GAMM|nr:hypothetical protein BN873_100043 [Candidatus Competibacter denitrificans Run_A_D11]
MNYPLRELNQFNESTLIGKQDGYTQSEPCDRVLDERPGFSGLSSQVPAHRLCRWPTHRIRRGCARVPAGHQRAGSELRFRP